MHNDIAGVGDGPDDAALFRVVDVVEFLAAHRLDAGIDLIEVRVPGRLRRLDRLVAPPVPCVGIEARRGGRLSDFVGRLPGRWLRRVAVLQPILELRDGHRRHRADSLHAFPVAEGVVIGGDRRFLAVEAEHDLVLVRRLRREVHLIDDEDVRRGRVLADIDIDVLAVLPLGALNIAVGGGHGDGPFLAARPGAAALRALRILDGDVEAVYADVALGVIPGLDLRVGRRGVDVRPGRLDVLGRGRVDGRGARAVAVGWLKLSGEGLPCVEGRLHARSHIVQRAARFRRDAERVPRAALEPLPL
jgi:hypothetical protein